MTYRTRLLAVALVGVSILAATPASGAPETFALGQSAASGALCHAVRDYQDALGQGRDSRAWRVRCRGYNAALGRIYQLPASGRAGWQRSLGERADCTFGRPARQIGVSGVVLAACRATQGGTPYVVFTIDRGKSVFVSEGLAPLADVLEAGLKVVAGVSRPPSVTDVQGSVAQAEIAADFPGMSGLAAAEAAAASDPERLRNRGYVQNNEWQFDEAETAFRALVNEAEARNAPIERRAEALLNLAINISNNGRFEEAEAFFVEAEGQIPDGDLLLQARSLNYRALHERNRGDFDKAIRAAELALQARVASAGTIARQGAVSFATGSGLVIDDGLARRLNRPTQAQAMMEAPSVSLADQLAIQDAQAYEIIGTSKAALGDQRGARAALERAQEILVRSQAAGHSNVWLRARVEADIAEVDLRQGRADAAVNRYTQAISVLRTRHAGTSAEGAMLLDLGRAQVAAGQDPRALATFERAMAVFREQRGGLGGSADAAAPYFDLLLKMIERDPGKREAYAALFFDAAQTVVSSATAETVNRLAARVASGDGEQAGLARAFEDARRRVRATESQIAGLQADGIYTGSLRAEVSQELTRRQAEAEAVETRLLAANPRYNQLVSPGAPTDDLQKALKADEVYVKLLPLAGRTYGVMLTRTSLKPYAVEMSRSRLAEAVKRLREPLEPGETLPPFDVAGSAGLFDRLFGPVRTDVLAARHLIYEPAGPLMSLPISVFVTESARPLTAKGEPDYTKVAWLGTRMDTSLVVSGASFLQSRAFASSKARQPYLGFGDPALTRGDERAYSSVVRSLTRRRNVLERVCGQARSALLNIEALPETAAEVRAVGASLGASEKVVIGSAFTDDALKARTDLSDYKVLYFATHGLLPQPDACIPEPALLTSLGAGDSDALLDSSEILDLKLDADLVVLAACNTGGEGGGADRTGLTGGGEALGGLTRAMVYAGSRALVVSHWSIDSAASVKLKTGFFASGAPSIASGMRQAQTQLQKDPAIAHPYFWAPFTVVGDGERPLPGRKAEVAAK